MNSPREDSVCRAESEIRDVIDAIPAMVWIAAPDGKATFINRAWTEYLGLSLEEVLGFDWPRTVHPDDVDRYLAAWRLSLASGQPLEQEVRYRRADGGYRWFFSRALPVRTKRGEIVEWYGIAADIEDRKRAQEAERRRESELRELMEAIPAMAWSASPDSSCTYVNKNWTEYTGLSLEATVGSGWLRAVHQQDAEQHLSSWQKSVATGQPFQNEVRFRRAADGQYRWFTVRGVPLLDERGRILKWYGIAVDVEDRKRAEQAREEAARRSERELREVIERIPAMVWMTLPDGTATFVNRGWTEYFGLSLEDLLGWGWTRIVHPDDVEQFVGKWRASLATGQPLEGEIRVRRADGEYRCFLVRVVPARDEQGKILNWYGAGTEIEDRKRAEQALKRSEAYLAEAQKLTKTGSWAWDPRADRILYCSDEIYRIFGVNPADGIPSIETLMQRVHPDDRPRIRARIEEGVRDKVEHSFEYRIMFPDGNVKYLRNLRRTVINDAGEVVEVIGTTMDITERTQAEEALRASEASLLEAQRLTRTCSWRHEILSNKSTVSPEGLLMFGIEPEEDASTADFYFRRMHPEDRPKVEQAYAAAVLGKTDFEADFRIVLPDGTIKNARSIGHPILDERGDVVEFVGASIDVTEHHRKKQALRRSEAYLAEAQRLAKTGSWAYNPAAEKAIYWSDEMLRMFGLDPQRSNFPDREEHLRLMHPEDRDRFNELYERSKIQKTDWNADYRIVLPDGGIKHFHVVHHPVLNESGDLVENIGTAIDVTEQAQARIELEKAFEEIKRLRDRLHDENLALREQIDQVFMFEDIVGTSSALQGVLSRLIKVAPTDSSVLVSGETGTGKELVARAIHKRSRRSQHAFVSVNCAALAPSLMSSELFGHEKGAFTGAMQRRLGRFELANGGTIFLDEIGELPLDTQVALLRVLQEREFERVGGTQPIHVDVRVIAATNRDLKAAIANGTFRQDLHYRLNVFPIALPPLREWQDDVLMLLEFFVHRFAQKMGKHFKRIDKRTVELFRSYPWPGNIRELQNVVERSVIVSSGGVFGVDAAWLSGDLPRVSLPQQPEPADADEDASRERQIIEDALAGSRGRVSGPNGAAARLRVTPSTLEYRIKKLRIRKSHFKLS